MKLADRTNLKYKETLHSVPREYNKALHNYLLQIVNYTRKNSINMTNHNLIWNPPLGHDGGEEFKAIPEEEKIHVSGLEVWTHNGPGGNETLKAIKIIWNTGESSTYGNPEGQSTATAFRSTDRITRMVIYAGDWIDSIYLESTRHPTGWRAGGSGGIAHEQDVGNGVFVGLWGRAGSDIDQLGSVFADPDGGKAE